MALDNGFLAVGKLLPDGVAAANEMLTQSHLTQNTQGQRPQACRQEEACIARSRMCTAQRMDSVCQHRCICCNTRGDQVVPADIAI